MKKLIYIFFILMLASCTGMLQITDPDHGVTYTSYPTYSLYPYHTVTYVRPVPHINKYSYYNPYYKPHYKPHHTHCHYKTGNTYYKHRKR